MTSVSTNERKEEGGPEKLCRGEAEAEAVVVIPKAADDDDEDDDEGEGGGKSLKNSRQAKVDGVEHLGSNDTTTGPFQSELLSMSIQPVTTTSSSKGCGEATEMDGSEK